MKKLFLLIFLMSFSYSFSQKNNNRLQKKLAPLIQQHKGISGIYVYDVKRNKTVSINADTLFPTASMVKVPILIGIMQKIEKGELNYHQSLT
jgi:beta-lactamase class A